MSERPWLFVTHRAVEWFLRLFTCHHIDQTQENCTGSQEGCRRITKQMGDSSALVAEKYLRGTCRPTPNPPFLGKYISWGHTLRTYARCLCLMHCFAIHAFLLMIQSLPEWGSQHANLAATKKYAEEVAEIIRGHVLCDKARRGSAAVGQTKRRISAYESSHVITYKKNSQCFDKRAPYIIHTDWSFL